MHLHGWPLLAGLVALYVALLAHEAGHVVAGQFAGFRFGLLGVGPVCIVRFGQKLRLRWLPPSHWGPFALAYPVTPDRIAARAAWYVAGGPLASLALALAAAACVWLAPDRAILRWATPLALVSASIFVATAQPFGTGAGVPSDGGRVWATLRGGADARATAALLALVGHSQAGVRPRDWDPALVAMAAEVRRPPAYLLAAATDLLRRSLDAGDLGAARAEIERIRGIYPRVPRWVRAEAAAEMAFWLAFYEKDPAAAAEFLRDARGLLVAPHRRLRAGAAILLRRGDLDGARSALDKADAALRESLETPSAFDQDLIDAVRREVEARMGTTS
jgi:hypothetical protein